MIEAFRGASLIEVRLVTGKRNQIRLQARLRGHTLVGEQRYILRTRNAAADCFRGRRCTLTGWRFVIPRTTDRCPLRVAASR